MRKLVVALAALLLVAVGAVAYASIPGPDGVIHACYKNNNPAQGAVIVIDHTASCPSGYTALNWNQTGPQGPVGPQGAAGVSGWEIVTKTVTTSTELSLQDHADCPSGKVALGGGGGIGTTDVRLFRSEPIGLVATDPQGWLVGAVLEAPLREWTIHIYVVCAIVG